MLRSTGFPPIVDSAATVLVLGSLPSRKSIEALEYYAHPQNAFWKIMGELFGAGLDMSYRKRTELLKLNKLAVWDVLASSIRPGSMDTNIDESTARPNDFSSFLKAYSDIRLVCFNGKKAASMFDKLVLSGHPELRSRLLFETLPSTSPAFASMTFKEKLKKWSIVLRAVDV
jgi:TDG/mug DNA glycosylase family protein